MFGKLFQSTFTGSMFGAGPTVFSVWAYTIAHAYKGEVELNPQLLAAILGTDPASVDEAIVYLCAPDPRSRNPEAEGRRLVHLAGFTFQVVTYDHYRAIRDNEARRDYNREAVAKHRAKAKAKSGSEIECKTAGNLHPPNVSAVSPRRRQKTDGRGQRTDGRGQTADARRGLDRNKGEEGARETTDEAEAEVLAVLAEEDRLRDLAERAEAEQQEQDYE